MDSSESNKNAEINNSRYSNHDDEKQEMLMRIYEYEHEISKKQNRRTFLIISCASIFFFLLLTNGKIKFEYLFQKDGIIAILIILLISVALGAIYYFVGISVFSPYFVANTEENKRLEYMKAEYKKEFGDTFW